LQANPFWVRRPAHAHGPIRYLIGFLFVRILGLADAKLWLNQARSQCALHALVAEGFV
jgi:hypothetical protein